MKPPPLVRRLWSITVVKKRVNQERWYTAIEYYALAADAAQALAMVKDDQRTDAEFISEPTAIGPLQRPKFWTITKDRLREMRGDPEPPPPPHKEPELNARRLGEVQLSLLHSLREHKGYSPNCGWTWDGHGTTVRMLDKLVQRKLVDKKEEQYTINKHGLAVLKEQRK